MAGESLVRMEAAGDTEAELEALPARGRGREIAGAVDQEGMVAALRREAGEILAMVVASRRTLLRARNNAMRDNGKDAREGKETGR